MVDQSIIRSKSCVKAVSLSLAVLAITAIMQAVIYVATNSVALLADLLHNVGDALTAVPLGAAFLMKSWKAEHAAGYFVVLTIFTSACIALVIAVYRLFHPLPPTHLFALGLAGVMGFIGNEIAAQIRLRAGRKHHSPALIADGQHAKVDGYVSLAVVASSIVVAIGFPLADPIIGLVITLVILRITWQSFRTVRNDHGHGH